MSRIFLLMLILVPGLALGAPLTLDQALRQALDGHPQAEVQQARADAARAAAGEAVSGLYPRLTLGEELYWTDEPAGSLFINLNHEELVVSPDADRYNFAPARKDFVTKLELTQPLFDSDLWYRRKRADVASAAVSAESRSNREAVVFQAFRAYLELRRAQAALSWAETGKAEAAEVARLAGEQEAAGVGLHAETLRAAMQLADAERELLAAENAQLLAGEALAVAIGRETGVTEIESGIPTERLVGEPPAGWERGDLEALQLRGAEADLASRQSRAAWLPKAGMAADYSLHDADPFGAGNGSWTLKANLTWELFDGFRRSHGSARAQAEKRAVAASYRDRQRQVALAVRSADLRAQEARQQLAVAQLAVEQGEESWRLYRERYTEGISSLADLLAAQRDRDRARYAVIAAENGWLEALGNRFFQRGTFVETILAEKENDR